MQGRGDKCTLEFATFPNREDKDDATSSMERRVEFLFIHRQRRPNALNITETSFKMCLKLMRTLFTNDDKPNQK